MNEIIFVTTATLSTVIFLALVFKKPLTALINRSRSVDVKVTKDGVEAAFRTDLEDLARESSATAKAVEASSPGPVEPTGSQQALPGGLTEQTAPGLVEGIEATVTVRQLIAIGADWGGLISEAKHLLDENDIPTPNNQSSLGDLLQAFDEDLPGILPERAENLAADADQLLQMFMTVEPGNVAHEDMRLFSIALTSLHKIISKAGSRARHPSRIRRPGL